MPQSIAPTVVIRERSPLRAPMRQSIVDGVERRPCSCSRPGIARGRGRVERSCSQLPPGGTSDAPGPAIPWRCHVMRSRGTCIDESVREEFGGSYDTDDDCWRLTCVFNRRCDWARRDWVSASKGVSQCPSTCRHYARRKRWPTSALAPERRVRVAFSRSHPAAPSAASTSQAVGSESATYLPQCVSSTPHTAVYLQSCADGGNGGDGTGRTAGGERREWSVGEEEDSDGRTRS